MSFFFSFSISVVFPDFFLFSCFSFFVLSETGICSSKFVSKALRAPLVKDERHAFSPAQKKTWHWRGERVNVCPDFVAVTVSVAAASFAVVFVVGVAVVNDNDE